MYFAVAAIAILGGLALAHVVGMHLASSLRLDPGNAREVMPSLPVAPMQSGRAATRWNRSVARVERALLRHFGGGVTGVHADALAAELAEDRTLVDAALERMREEIPCRLRITRSGRMLHDFEAGAIEQLRSKRRRSLPFRIFLLGLMALANIGAIWPVLLILFLAIYTLQGMLERSGEEATTFGLLGLLGIVAVFAIAMLVSWVVHLVLTPWSGPQLGGVAEGEYISSRKSASSTGDSFVWGWFGGSSSSSSGSSSSGGGGSSDGDGGAGQAIIIIILIAVIILCTIALYVWARGLWRALSQRDDHLDRVSPSFWVRTAEAVDTFERFIPTNDLVGRVYRALRRAYAHRRPVDADLGLRILGLATRIGGPVSTVDIVLEEGLSIDEATEVGSRLCGITGGKMLVSDEGDLVFSFPKSAMDEVDVEREPDLLAEYCTFVDGDPLGARRRNPQSDDNLPVNMVGLTLGHVKATDRLVGGTYLMAISGIYFLGVDPIISIPLLSFAVAATCLSGATRYTAKALATQGVARDARRAVVRTIRDAIEENATRADLTGVASEIHDTLQPAWPSVEMELFAKEVTAVAVDLGLSPDLDARGEMVVPLDELSRRIAAARGDAIEPLFEEFEMPESEEEDDVIFETRVSHDRVTALA